MYKVVDKGKTSKQEKPLVSIVILTYQRFDLIQVTLQSIFEQDYPNLEVIISDDGSKEFPDVAIREWISIHAATHNKIPVTMVHSEENRGIVKNAIGAAARARGRYIKFLSPGDALYSPNSVDSLVSCAEATGRLIVTSISAVYVGDTNSVRYHYPSYRKIRRLNRCNSKQNFMSIARKNIISAAATMYHRSYFEQYGIDESYKYLDDWPVWLAFLRNGGKFGVLDKVTAFYLVDGNGLSGKNAFDSAILQDDLRHCYEKEILPYCSQFGLFSRWIIEYHYALLKHRPFSAKECIEYCPFIIFHAVKKYVKGKILKN